MQKLRQRRNNTKANVCTTPRTFPTQSDRVTTPLDLFTPGAPKMTTPGVQTSAIMATLHRSGISGEFTPG